MVELLSGLFIAALIVTSILFYLFVGIGIILISGSILGLCGYLCKGLLTYTFNRVTYETNKKATS